MSLSELAKRSGIAKGALSTIESGRQNPTLETCQRIAKGLSVNLVELFTCTEVLMVGRDDAPPQRQRQRRR